MAADNPAGCRQRPNRQATVIHLFYQKKIRPDSWNEYSQIGIPLAKTCRSHRHFALHPTSGSPATCHTIMAILALPFLY
jgi:hypothetical protein